jgi:predicted nucleic acid-binding protein
MYFLDTSYLLALELLNDQNHQAAQSHWQLLTTSPLSLITTSYVLSETVTYLNSRHYHTRFTNRQ